MPLTFAQPGMPVRIRRITGRNDIRRHLAGLGFVEGESVTIISERAGNMILAVKDCRVALDRSLAHRIHI